MTLASFGSFVVTVGIVFALILAGTLLIRYVRANFKELEMDPAGSEGFTLHELRKLHAQGQLSETEYQAARTIILGNAENLGKRMNEDKPNESTSIHDLELPENLE